MAKRGKALPKRKSATVSKARLLRPYPRMALSRAVDLAQKIRDLNGGNPWTPKDIAAAVGVAPRSTNFQYLLAAARDFGLVEGSSRADAVTLSTIGRELVYAANAEVEMQKKREAFSQIKIFKDVFEHYRGNHLPEMRFLANTLESKFSLPAEFHHEFSTVFQENCDYVGFSPDLEIGEAGTLPHPGPATIIVGAPAGKSGIKQKAFVIMPFVEKSDRRMSGFFQEVLRALIIPAATEAGFVVKTANRQGSDVIQSTIINELLDADLVIADLTDHNPNVLFELGLRMSERNKPVALLKSKDTGRLFDVDNMMRVYEYDQTLWVSAVERDRPNITQHIRATWEGRETVKSYIEILRRGAKDTA